MTACTADQPAWLLLGAARAAETAATGHRDHGDTTAQRASEVDAMQCWEWARAAQIREEAA